jgi:hypothetical protein
MAGVNRAMLVILLVEGRRINGAVATKTFQISAPVRSEAAPRHVASIGGLPLRRFSTWVYRYHTRILTSKRDSLRAIGVDGRLKQAIRTSDSPHWEQC